MTGHDVEMGSTDSGEVKDYFEIHLKPYAIIGRWTKNEIVSLQQARQRLATWPDIAGFIGTHNAKQCETMWTLIENLELSCFCLRIVLKTVCWKILFFALLLPSNCVHL